MRTGEDPVFFNTAVSMINPCEIKHITAIMVPSRKGNIKAVSTAITE